MILLIPNHWEVIAERIFWVIFAQPEIGIPLDSVLSSCSILERRSTGLLCRRSGNHRM